MTITDTDKADIRQLDLKALQDIFVSMGEKKFRATQVHEWLWKKGARTFTEMTNLSKALREKLEDRFAIKCHHYGPGTT